ncbi:MAG TPA: hypothetical protein VNB54_08405 [Alphaproteobacteria bacterium]|nr:hypothetical protein [Alphaproteobacteria bacterium]
MGESEMLPDACELLVTVRDAPPAAAVIVTDEAFVVCHVSVTLCPLAIEVLLAEKVRVGEPDPGFPIACDPHPVNVVRKITATIAKLQKRMAHDFMWIGPRPKYFYHLRF